MIVFGLQTTAYGGEYCYMEYGYCFKSINKYLPYPKFNELDLNCGRIVTIRGQAIVFEEVDAELLENIQQVVDREIEEMSNLVKMERSAFIQHYLSGDTGWYILGDTTAAYFGLSRKDFKATPHNSQELSGRRPNE